MIVIGLDALGRVLLFNDYASRVTGIPVDEALGKDAFTLLFGAAGPSIRERLFSDENLPPILDLALRTRESTTRLCRFYVSRDTAWGGERPTHLLVAADNELEAHTRRAELHRGRIGAVRNLGSGFAHEVRNPLNGALLATRLLRRSLAATDEEKLRLTVVIEGELNRISALTDDFLAFATPERLLFAPVDIGAVCAAVLEKVRAETATTATLLASLPTEALVVDADERHLELALRHLVSNAVEALRDDRGRVLLHAMREPAHATIHIEDDGIGVEAPHEVIFDPFFTTKSMRTGLGLAIAQRAALDHGGSLEVSSAPARTVFSLRLPLLSPKKHTRGEGTGVLVIDRHTSSAQTLAQLLASDGYDAAIDDARGHAEVVVTALRGVEPSPKAMAAAVRGSWPRRTVLYTTHRPQLALPFLTALGGQSRVLPKPLDYGALTRELHLATGSRASSFSEPS